MARCAQQTGVFRGDGEGLVDALVRVSQVPAVSKNASPDWYGRELQPVDNSWLSCAPVELKPLESSRGRKFPAAGRISPRTSVDSPRKGSQHQTKRSKAAGSPPRSASPGNSSACACPALAASPKPEQLPMPTTGLLSRAFVHGRSPSPPKDAAVASFFAYNQVQQLIRPVAA